jgi:hypothetical protein
MQFFIPGRPDEDTTTSATCWAHDQANRGNSWAYATTSSIEAAAVLRAMQEFVRQQQAAEDELAKLEREACLPAVPTLQLMQQRRCDRARARAEYLQQVAKAMQHTRRCRKHKLRKPNHRKQR